MLDKTPKLREQPRDLLWWHRLYYDGPMPTRYLLAYVPPSARGNHMRLTDMKKTGYIYEPIKRLKLFNSQVDPKIKPFQNDPSVYAVDTKAVEYLISKGFASKNPHPINKDTFCHEFMLSCTSASIELGALKAGAEYHFEYQFHSGSREIPCEIEYTAQKRGEHGLSDVLVKVERPLIPDAVFKLRKDGGERLFFLEVDRGTEPTWSSDPKRKNWRANFKQYIKVVESKYYKDHFNVDCPALALFLFNERAAMIRAQEELLYQTNGRGKNYMLFGLWTDFYEETFIPREINYSFIEKSWERVGSDREGKPHTPINLI